MKEQLYTIPLNDAVNAGDECPFCYIERIAEQNALDFTLGSSSSYMESDIRERTDTIGFCQKHMKKMFDYGNTLGNALILQTHYKKIRKEMHELFASYTPGKSSFLAKLRKSPSSENENSLAKWANSKDCSCCICQDIDKTMQRYIATFFHLYKEDPAFKEKVFHSKGFCLSHFGLLCKNADLYLNDKEKADFYPAVFQLMESNFERLQTDIDWLTDKFDYRNRDADWKNSKDAVQRGMQKLRGGYPADAAYQQK